MRDKTALRARLEKARGEDHEAAKSVCDHASS